MSNDGVDDNFAKADKIQLLVPASSNSFVIIVNNYSQISLIWSGSLESGNKLLFYF